MSPAYRRRPARSGTPARPGNGPVDHNAPVLAAPRGLCNRVSVDQDGPENFSVTGAVTEDRVTVEVTGEVDMSTADAMYRAATPDGIKAATLDLRGVTFFDSAAIHALIRLTKHYSSGLEVIPSPQVYRVLDISGLSTQPWLQPPE
jgi:anti-anti-sigma factor